MKKEMFLLITLYTILFFRILTFIIVFVWNSQSGWQILRNEFFNYYPLGILLLLLGFLGKYIGIIKKYKTHLLAIGTGAIIDSISGLAEDLSLISLPTSFRNSIEDLILIIITYFIFTTAVLVIGNIKK